MEERMQPPKSGGTRLRAVVGFVSAGTAVVFQGLFHLAVPQAPFAPFSIGEFVVRNTPAMGVR